MLASLCFRWLIQASLAFSVMEAGDRKPYSLASLTSSASLLEKDRGDGESLFIIIYYVIYEISY